MDTPQGEVVLYLLKSLSCSNNSIIFILSHVLEILPVTSLEWKYGFTDYPSQPDSVTVTENVSYELITCDRPRGRNEP